jgi:hypothetical protein
LTTPAHSTRVSRGRISVTRRLLSNPLVASVVACIAMSAVGFILTAGAAQAADPAANSAVREGNARIKGYFDYSHRAGEDDVFVTGPSAPGMMSFDPPEQDIEAGGVIGTYTFPVAESIGARVIIDPNATSINTPGLPHIRSSGIALGGDLFWRDPNVGEFGVGPRYAWNHLEPAGNNSETHTGGAEASATLFLEDFGIGPVDLGVDGRYLYSETDDNGFLIADRTWGVSGGARAYVSDIVALGLGGSWTRERFEAGDKSATTTADLSMDILLPFSTPLTLGATASFGQYERFQSGLATYGVDYYSLGVALTVSFATAKSLVELERHFY